MPALAMLLPFHTIWGPAGANLGIPTRFTKKMGLSLREKTGNSLRKLLLHKLSAFNPFLLMAYAGADKILAINPDCKSLVPAGYRHKVRIAAANAVANCQASPRHLNSDPIRIVYVGRPLYFKGLSLAVQAFHRFSTESGQRAKLMVITGLSFKKVDSRLARFISNNGHPPQQRSSADRHAIRELHRLVEYIENHAITADVEIVDSISPQSVMDELRRARVLLHPSFEGGGVVVLEAMSVGTPVICLDAGGPGEYVDETCGLKVQVGEYEETVQNLACALQKLCSDNQLWNKLSRGAVERVQDRYLWSHKAKIIASSYADLMTASALTSR
jgi:glycosyltransferase involved in cell wall biosynthesis